MDDDRWAVKDGSGFAFDPGNGGSLFSKCKKCGGAFFHVDASTVLCKTCWREKVNYRSPKTFTSYEAMNVGYAVLKAKCVRQSEIIQEQRRELEELKRVLAELWEGSPEEVPDLGVVVVGVDAEVDTVGLLVLDDALGVAEPAEDDPDGIAPAA
jgi:hypothetical protein